MFILVSVLAINLHKTLPFILQPVVRTYNYHGHTQADGDIWISIFNLCIGCALYFYRNVDECKEIRYCTRLASPCYKSFHLSEMCLHNKIYIKAADKTLLLHDLVLIVRFGGITRFHNHFGIIYIRIKSRTFLFVRLRWRQGGRVKGRWWWTIIHLDQIVCHV